MSHSFVGANHSNAYMRALEEHGTHADKESVYACKRHMKETVLPDTERRCPWYGRSDMEADEEQFVKTGLVKLRYLFEVLWSPVREVPQQDTAAAAMVRERGGVPVHVCHCDDGGLCAHVCG